MCEDGRPLAGFRCLIRDMRRADMLGPALGIFRLEIIELVAGDDLDDRQGEELPVAEYRDGHLRALDITFDEHALVYGERILQRILELAGIVDPSVVGFTTHFSPTAAMIAAKS